MTTPKRPPRHQLAKAIVDLATGEAASDRKTTVRARKASPAGGSARARASMPEQRSEIAREAAAGDASYGGGVTTKLWEIGDIAKLVQHAEGPAKKCGSYKKREET